LCFFFLLSKFGDDKFEDEEDYDDDGDKENEDIKPTINKKAKLGPPSNTANVEISSKTSYIARQTWMPNHTMAVWENDLLRQMVTVVVVLDAGVDVNADVKCKVSDDGRELQIKQKLVERLANVDMLHEYFRKKDKDAYPPYHPKIMAFHKFMKSIRKEKGDAIFHTACIRLPFQVQTDIVAEYKLGDNAGARLLYVDLRAVITESYSTTEQSSLLMIN
jgi:hypothetical protein